MKDLRLLDAYRNTSARVVELFGSTGDSNSGVFEVPGPRISRLLRVIATADAGWDHVSVSLSNRCPTWEEMEHIKRLFFRDDETAMQLHVPPTDHVNVKATCLHLWRPHVGEIPRPPAWMV